MVAFTACLAASVRAGATRHVGRAAAAGLRSQLQPHRRCRRCLPPLASAAASVPAPDSSNSGSSSGSHLSDAVEPTAAAAVPQQPSSSGGGLFGWLRAQQQRSAELRARLASLGLAAVLSYGGWFNMLALLLLLTSE
jgi:hypothetical protein